MSACSTPSSRRWPRHRPATFMNSATTAPSIQRSWALWQTEAGQPNEACHIWAYPDLNARAEARGNAMKDPEWQAFLGKGPGFLEEMHSTIMLPAPHSPLK